MSAARYWDGFVRTAVSHRFVAAPGQNQTVRVELLSCGHEQSFSGNFCRSSIAARICRACEDANNRVPLEVVR